MNFAQRSKYARSNAFKHWKQSHMERRPGETATMEEVEQVDEAGTGLLMNFIKAKGLNPLSMDGNQKQAYSRSSEFRIFKQKHQKEEFDRLIETYGAENLLQIVMQKQELQETSGMGERGDDWNEQSVVPAKKAKEKKIKEELDKADTVTMDIPLLIRVLEYAREDAKTDMDLHKVVENLIKMRDEGTLSMAQYDKIIAIKEAIEAKYGKDYQDMVKRVGQKAAQKPVDMKSLAARMQAAYAKKDIKELKNIPDNMDSDDHVTREEKKMKGPDPCWNGYQMVGTKKKGGRTVPNCVPEQVQEGLGNVEDSPMSATNSVKAMESAHRKNQMKSARMIKSLYKKKVKENLYDWEKDDKPNAKIVVKGGTTMTGQPRDTIEIEPVLKTRPNQTKPTV
jgi:dephospho-CoA kinase